MPATNRIKEILVKTVVESSKEGLEMEREATAHQQVQISNVRFCIPDTFGVYQQIKKHEMLKRKITDGMRKHKKNKYSKMVLDELLNSVEKQFF